MPPMLSTRRGAVGRQSLGVVFMWERQTGRCSSSIAASACIERLTGFLKTVMIYGIGPVVMENVDGGVSLGCDYSTEA